MNNKWVSWRYFGLILVIGGMAITTAIAMQASNLSRLSIAETKIEALEKMPAKVDAILEKVTRIETIQQEERRPK